MTLERTAKRLRADEHDYIPNSDSDKRDDSLHSAAVLSLPLSGSREAIYDDSDRKGNSEDIPRVFKRLPGSPWLIVQTTLNHVFYYNPETRAKTWDLPPEVEDIVGELIALAMIPHDAEEESFAEDEYESAHEDEQERDDQEEEEGRNDMEDATQPIETDAEPSIPLKEREDAFKV